MKASFSGPHEIVLDKPGFSPVSTTLRAVRGEMASLLAPLASPPAIKVEAEPEPEPAELKPPPAVVPTLVEREYRPPRPRWRLALGGVALGLGLVAAGFGVSALTQEGACADEVPMPAYENCVLVLRTNGIGAGLPRERSGRDALRRSTAGDSREEDSREVFSLNHQVNRSFFLGAALLLAGCSSLWKPFAQSNPASCADPTDPPCGAGLVCDLIRNKCMTASLEPTEAARTWRLPPDLRACTKPVKFLPSMTFQGGVQTVWLGAADMNGDAKLDIVHLSLSDPTNDMEYLPGDGSGGFGARRVIYGGANSGPSALADFNKDGKPDLVVPVVGFRTPGPLCR